MSSSFSLALIWPLQYMLCKQEKTQGSDMDLSRRKFALCTVSSLQGSTVKKRARCLGCPALTIYWIPGKEGLHGTNLGLTK